MAGFADMLTEVMQKMGGGGRPTGRWTRQGSRGTTRSC